MENPSLGWTSHRRRPARSVATKTLRPRRTTPPRLTESLDGRGAGLSGAVSVNDGGVLDRTRRFPARALAIGLLAIGLIGVLARVLIISKSIGSNDMKTWLSFATSIDRTSLGEVYDRVGRFNHPPL